MNEYVRYSYKLLLIVLLVLFACDKPGNDKNDNGTDNGEVQISFKGRVHHDQQGIAGVVVTDGKNFAQTDEKGYYTLPYDPRTKHIYISTPSGYAVGREGSVPQFWVSRKSMAHIHQVNFELVPLNVSDRVHYFIGSADPQVRNMTEVNKLQNILDFMKNEIQDKELQPVHIMVAGDLVFDQPNMHPAIKTAFSTLNEHVYYAIGNHDYIFDRNQSASIQNNLFADSTYIRHYGPTYYSFNRGQLHYIVLDNILFEGGADVKYNLGFSQEQLDWVERNLSYVPSDRVLVVMFHGPSKTRFAARYGNSDALHQLLRGYREVHILSGHTHYNSVLDDETSIISHTLGTYCGGWWEAPVNLCGTPLGYKIFKADGTNITWEYRAWQYPEKQFTVFPPGPRDPRLRPENELLVNVWDWERTWSVRYSEDGGETFQNMTRLVNREYDPTALASFGEKGDQTVPGRSWIAASTTDHLFSCVPSPGVKEVKIQVTTRFGEEFSEVVSW